MIEHEQISIFGQNQETRPTKNCYCCKHFAQFKEPREYTTREGKFCVFGICFKRFGKNGSFTILPVYIPAGVCKDYAKRKEKV